MKKLILLSILLVGCSSQGPRNYLDYYDAPVPMNYIDPIRFQQNLRDCRSATHCRAEDLFKIA